MYMFNCENCNFVIIIICQCIRKEYIDYYEDRQSLMFLFDEDVIVLDLPDSPPLVVNDWKILPMTHPEV